MSRVLPLVAVLMIVGSAAAQTPPATPFRAGVELVRLDVRIADAAGRPVDDVRQDEVEVIEQGRPRPVLLFQHVQEPLRPYAEVASRTIAGEVSTNKGAARGHLYVIVFDQTHITPGSEQRARRAAQRFVETSLRPGDRVALYALPGPGPQIGFTADAKRVVAELATVRGMAETQQPGAVATMTEYEAFAIARGNNDILQRVQARVQAQAGASDVGARGRGTAATGGIDGPLGEDPLKEDARAIADRADGQSRRALAMLADVLRPMRAIEGRKTVLLVSEGFFGDHLAREIEQVAAAAAESYSVIHAIDINQRGPDLTLDQPAGPDAFAAIHDRLDPLGSLAEETDGTLVIDAGPRVEEVFARTAAQVQDYYLVGFAPAESALKNRGAYQRVSVRVRRSGVAVSTRTGFVLVDPASGLDRRQAIDRALAAPFPLQGLPVQYTTYTLRGSGGVQRVIVTLDAELPLASPEHPQPADVVFVVRAAGDGRIAASGTDVIALPERHDANATTGTGTFRVQFELPAGDYLMRAVVREPGGLIGSADRRFTVRPLDGPSPTSGDLVLSGERGELPVRAVAYAEDGMSGVLELYGRTPEQLRGVSVAADLVPVGEAGAVLSGIAQLQEIQATGGGATREARIALLLTGITPGTYVLRATMKAGADTLSQVAREIDVRYGRRPAAGEPAEPTPFDPQIIVHGAFARTFLNRPDGHPSPSVSATRRGLDRFGARDYPAAIELFNAALEADPQNAPAAFFLGWAFHAAGDDRQAISAWRRAAFVDPTMVPVHLALADLYVQLAQPALAVQALRAGLAALPEAPELIDRLSAIEQRR